MSTTTATAERTEAKPATRERSLILGPDAVRKILAGTLTSLPIRMRRQPFESERGGGVWMQWEGRRTAAMNVRRRDVIDKAAGKVIESVEYTMPVAEWLAERSQYKVGTRVWVRETWQVRGLAFGMSAAGTRVAAPEAFHYRATDDGRWKAYWGGWRSPATMPRWASRLTLEVTAVRAEHVGEWFDVIDFRVV